MLCHRKTSWRPQVRHATGSDCASSGPGWARSSGGPAKPKVRDGKPDPWASIARRASSAQWISVLPAAADASATVHRSTMELASP